MKQKNSAATARVSVIGQGTWYIDRGNRRSAVAALAPGYRSRHDPHRYRGDVWRCRTGRRRSDRRTARRDLPGLESIAEQRVAARHHHRLRAFAGAAENRPARLLSAALARILSAGRDGRCVRGTGSAGKIRSWGVSNFDADDLDEMLAVAGEGKIACNQVLYHLQERAIEHAVIPWCAAARRRGGRLFAVRSQ